MSSLPPSQTFSQTTIQIIHKYMLDINNPFHRLAAQKIVEEFQPHRDPNYQLKLNSRMKLSLGRELNLLPNHLLLLRREPAYLKDVHPVRNALVMYGVDRMSNKNLNLFIYGQSSPELSKSMKNPRKNL